jgi:hypothetical protein
MKECQYCHLEHEKIYNYDGKILCERCAFDKNYITKHDSIIKPIDIWNGKYDNKLIWITALNNKNILKKINRNIKPTLVLVKPSEYMPQSIDRTNEFCHIEFVDRYIDFISIHNHYDVYELSDNTNTFLSHNMLYMSTTKEYADLQYNSLKNYYKKILLFELEKFNKSMNNKLEKFNKNNKTENTLKLTPSLNSFLSYFITNNGIRTNPIEFFNNLPLKRAKQLIKWDSYNSLDLLSELKNGTYKKDFLHEQYINWKMNR